MLRDAAREGAVARAGVPCTLVRTGALRSVPAGSGGPRVLQVQSIFCEGGGGGNSELLQCWTPWVIS